MSLGRLVGALVVVLLLLVVPSVPVVGQSQTSPFAVESLMSRLHFYGPLFDGGDGSWAAHPMTLIADYTYQINVTLEAQTFFLLVNMVPVESGTTTTAEGEHQQQQQLQPDWQACQLGRGVDPGRLEIGGGNIPVIERGDYTLTYFTPSLLSSARAPMDGSAAPSQFRMEGRHLWPAVQVHTSAFVTTHSPISLQVHFTSPISLAAVRANRSQIDVQHAALTNLTEVSSTRVDLVLVPSADRDEFIIRIRIPEGFSHSETNDTAGALIVGRPTTATSFTLIHSPPSSRRGTGVWGRLVSLRDSSSRWPVDQPPPPGGWYVTPIHANLIAPTGQVLITGWGRSEEFACRTDGGSRRIGVSFLLDPAALLNLPSVSASPGDWVYQVDPLDENGRNAQSNGSTSTRDVLTCSGHAPLRDGRKLYAGGAPSLHLGTSAEAEAAGLSYARVWSPKAANWTQVQPDLPGGTRAWHPTATRLEDGRVLMTGGFTSDTCPASSPSVACLNPSLAIFNVSRYDAGPGGGTDPWEFFLPANESDHRIDPGKKDYTRVIVLPESIVAGGYERTVAMMGAAGVILLVNLDPSTPNAERFYTPANSRRPTSGGCNAESTATLVGTGELLSLGGCASSWLDLYDPRRDTWRSIDTGIPRDTPSSLLLPDGTVLLVNGENGAVDQSADAPAQSGDPRYPQVFDPFTWSLSTYPELEDTSGDPSIDQAPFRGYHNLVGLLKDGRVLIGGGVHQRRGGDIGPPGPGCEQPNMRIYDPPYLAPFEPAAAAAGSPATRPEWDTTTMLDDAANANASPLSPSPAAEAAVQFVNGAVEPFFMRPNQTILVSFTRGPLQTNLTDGRAPVVLMALSAFTHAFDQNQRYVPLAYATDQDAAAADAESATVRLRLPPSSRVLPGEYFLFLLSPLGVPSVGLQARVLAQSELAETAYDYPLVPGGSLPAHPSPSYHPAVGGSDDGIWTHRSMVIVASLGGVGILVFCALAAWFWQSERRNDRHQRQTSSGPDDEGVGLTRLVASAGRKFTRL